MEAKTFFEKISEETGIRQTRAFWNESELGKKPNEYFTWRLNAPSADVLSEDGEEVLSFSYRVSVFTKQKDSLQELCEFLSEVAFQNGASASHMVFEDYEKDTGYAHGEINIEIILT